MTAISRDNINAMNWPEVKEKIMTRWSRFTDVEADSIRNDLGNLTEKLQRTYGYGKDFADYEANRFKNSVNNSNKS